MDLLSDDMYLSGFEPEKSSKKNASATETEHERKKHEENSRNKNPEDLPREEVIVMDLPADANGADWLNRQEF